MILTEENIDDRKIEQLVGESIKLNWRKPEAKGGPGLFLKSFINKSGGFESIPIDSKCNLEKRINGLLLHTNFSNKIALIPIPKDDILEIKITRGKEEINPTPFYPMWILMKLGVSVLKARYFGLRMNQYSIGPMELNITARNYEMDFVANGFLFERQLDFLKGLDLGDKLNVILKGKGKPHKIYSE
ncbi:hypothetical protein [Flagellimonas allohymeniacidonis]|uniref:Uncharacterized protein n=1 Tax=Flagellimonas allohymeniacidonis TaxID=2517819 RepID=A0A4Q8QBC7_9FLAO|nr:hypothetical protein [Allomuricauda hymeniacidonis]TAI46954.1 hypothetical protein EW142_09650 [Allomuricauda hymeniacidonis]